MTPNRRIWLTRDRNGHEAAMTSSEAGIVLGAEEMSKAG